MTTRQENPDRVEDEAPPQLCVLVADDIAGSREALAEQVLSMGHRCLLARSGAETLAQVARERPDVVLLDLLMPDMDGFEVTRRLRQQAPGLWLPVIVTSALQGEEHFVHALSQGADDYLSRPVSFELLAAKLRHYRRVLALQSRGNQLAERQRAIHDHIVDAVITLDAAGQVNDANRSAERLLGAQGRPLTGQSCLEVFGLPLPELLVRREIELGSGDPDTRSLAVSVGSWTDQGRAFYTVALHDLSEQRRVERMKSEFLATVSHELRTPLTSILGALGLLAAGAAGALPPPAQELADVARRNGERLSRLIDDVLDLTKLEGGRMPMHLRSVSLAGLLTETLAANQAYAQRSQVQLTLECRAEGARARVDADRLMQVMANLLSNAIKHSPPKSLVRVLLYGTAQGWRIDVIDQGPGIPQGFLPQLFDKFAQADGSDRRVQGGTGLGLYISRLLVDRMGGQILAQSEPGQGSTFSLLLPPDAQAAGAWILCIDRDHQRLGRTCDWLGEGRNVRGVADLAGAQQMLQQWGPPKTVVADPQAQGNADSFCKSLRALSPDAMFLLMSESVDEAFAEAHQMTWIDGPDGGREKLLAALEAGPPDNPGRGKD